jgi:hypothetical protein
VVLLDDYIVGSGGCLGAGGNHLVDQVGGHTEDGDQGGDGGEDLPGEGAENKYLVIYYFNFNLIDF